MAGSSLLIILISLSLADAHRLKFVHSIWRHGDRTPLYTFATNPVQEANWTLGEGGFGVLTPLGMEQQFELGRTLRKRYIDSGFVSPKYNGKEVEFHSLTNDRVLTSAFSNAMGMFRDLSGRLGGESYPTDAEWPQGVMPIPIHALDETTQTLDECKQSGRLKELIDLVRISVEFQKSLITPQAERISNEISSKTGVEMNAETFKQFYEAALIERNYFPDNVAKWCSDELFEELQAYYSTQFDYDDGQGIQSLIKDVNVSVEIPRINGGWIIQSLMEMVRGAVAGTSPVKYYALSAYDEAITGVLNALGVKSRLFRGQPGFASCILFELWIDENDEPHLKVLYRNGPEDEFAAITSLVPGCSLDLCHLSIFEFYAHKYRNYINNSLYPVRPLYFVSALAGVVSYNVKFGGDGAAILDVPALGSSVLGKSLRIATSSLVLTCLPLVSIRLFLRAFYFRYKGFMLENSKKPSITTRIWGAVRNLLSFAPPLLKSCDALLPSPPVPDLEGTVERYLHSIRHVHEPKEYEEIALLAKEFLEGDGAKLQRYAKFYSLFVDNYITGFWEKYAYLYNRAAHFTLIETLSMLAMDRQTFTPIGDGLLCARHYDKMYAVTRVPDAKIDTLKNNGISRHVAVFYQGRIYRVDVADANGRLHSIEELTDIYIELFGRADAEVDEVTAKLAALTHDKRAGWAANRERFFVNNTVNAETLEMIESAILVVFANDREDWGYDKEHPEVLSRYMGDILTGNGDDRWVDKSLNYILSANGRVGGTTEHSIADGSEFVHIMENYIRMDTKILDGNFPMRCEITRCYDAYQPVKNDVDFVSEIFREWGKGRIKACGVSPDGFMQIFMQRIPAYSVQDQGRFVLTYESASARFYKNSRTETLRSVTDESCVFVKAMEDPESGAETRIALLKAATTKHTENNKACMLNKGVDRHLFVLYVLLQGTGTSSPFLDHYINQTWELSTSHIPAVTNKLKEDDDIDKSWLGACFAAVSKTGYGVAYRFAGNHAICIHISSYNSAANTDTQRFHGRLVEALHEMSALFA